MFGQWFYFVILNFIVMKKFFGLLAVLLCFGTVAFAAAQPSDYRDEVGFSTTSSADLSNDLSLSNGEGFDFGTASWLVAYEVPTSVVVFRANEGDVSEGYGNDLEKPPVANVVTLDDPIDPGRWC